MEKTIAELEAATAVAKEKAEAAGGTDESLNQALTEAEAALLSAKKEEEEKRQDIDYKKESEALDQKGPKPGERDKAKFTVGKIFERFPDLKDEIAPSVQPPEDSVEQRLIRNQVEGVIRQRVREAGIKDEVGAVAYYMKCYDRIPHSPNIYDDVDDAMWLGDKNRTRNTLQEMKRTPPEPTPAGGPGQKPPLNTAPQLPPEEVKRLIQAGMKQVHPGKWEGVATILEWNPQEKKWDSKRK